MKKSSILFSIMSIVGAAIMCVGLLTDIDYYSVFLSSLGCAIIVSNLVQLVRNLYWQSPKHKAEYEARAQEALIDLVDERNQSLRSKAGHITYQIMFFVLLELAVILSLLRVEPWVIGMIFLLFIFQWVVGIVVYRVLQKKM
ncbi:MAG: hypothetical protein J1E01_05055 [Acetatifactor sp.]|nr:hypothetical protein [Acetatifactor sp.]